MPEKDIAKAHKRYSYLTFHAQDLIFDLDVNHLQKYDDSRNDCILGHSYVILKQDKGEVYIFSTTDNDIYEIDTLEITHEEMLDIAHQITSPETSKTKTYQTYQKALNIVGERVLFEFVFKDVISEYAQIMEIDENELRIGLWGLDFWESVPDVAGTDFVLRMTDGKFAGTEDLKKYFLTNALKQIDERKAFIEKAWINKR